MTIVVSAAEEFVPPSAPDFWQPLVGDGAFAITRPMVVMVLVTIVLAVVMMLATRRLGGRPRTRPVPPGGRLRPGPQLDRPRHHRHGRTSGPTSRCCFTLFTVILRQQPDGHHPVRPVPDDEPDRLPARPRARRLRRLPGGRRPAPRPRRLPQEPGAQRAAVLGRAGRVRPRAGDVPGHPAGDADAAALRQHVRRPHPAAAVRTGRGVPAAPRRGPAEAGRDPRPSPCSSCSPRSRS